jgi:hypothetical protein
MKTIAAALGAALLATAVLAGPAQAHCTGSGHEWSCGRLHHADVRADRLRLHRMRARVRHDWYHLRQMQALLRRDIKGGNPSDVRRDANAVRRAQRDLLGDHRGLRDARQQLRVARTGNY